MCLCVCLATNFSIYIILFISRCLSWWYCLSCLIRWFFFFTSCCTKIFNQSGSVTNPASNENTRWVCWFCLFQWTKSISVKTGPWFLIFFVSVERILCTQRTQKPVFASFEFLARFPCLCRKKVEKIRIPCECYFEFSTRLHTTNTFQIYSIHTFMVIVVDSYVCLVWINLDWNIAGSLTIYHPRIHCTNCTNKSSKINSNLKG